jgi:hypothetical protein
VAGGGAFVLEGKNGMDTHMIALIFWILGMLLFGLGAFSRLLWAPPDNRYGSFVSAGLFFCSLSLLIAGVIK